MKITKVIVLGLLGLLAVAACYPIFFVVVGSFMSPEELSRHFAPILYEAGENANWSFLPEDPTLRSYIHLFFDTPEFFVTFWNSVKMVAGVLLGQLLVGVPAAWAFARYQFKFKKALFMLYIILMLMPFQVLMLSEYLILKQLSLIDTYWAIILPGVFSTFPVFIMYHFFRSIPDAVIESAKLDGAGEFQIFLRIGVPLGAPGIISSLVLQFLEYWNLIEQPLTFLEDQSLWPMSLLLPNLPLNNAGFSLCASVIMLIPAILVFLFGKNHLEQGIAATAVKE